MKKSLTLKFLQLDDRKLSEQWLFRLSILIPLIISIMLCIPLWLKTEWDLSAQGYDLFLNLYKLPIGVLSLSIPFVAIVAHIHRTIQTSEQINTTRRKNAADSFFSHHKFMIEAINKISEKDMTILNNYKYKIDDPYHLYANFFKNSSYENGIDTRNIPFLVSEIEKEVDEIKKSITNAREEFNNKHLKIILLSELLISIRTLEGIMTIYIPESKHNYVVMDRNDTSTVMLVMAARSEIDIKERLDNLLYCIRKVFQLLNIKFNDGDDIHFYSKIKTPNYQFFNEVFENITPAITKEQYALALKSSTKLDSYYFEYNKKLKKQKNSIPH
ncbi:MULTISPECIES: hypothetical protein [unclassified Serratia (in: enterobacteria)]|uniref:hypothetical protein n=1 Tax=unclassified Serratia (in: enterobacteria) TaxID=2647522 RepID=UPI0018AB5A68|nr:MULTISPECIES: hypothetical protein [unclassified Serratia (in: enterobacteria)]